MTWAFLQSILKTAGKHAGEEKAVEILKIKTQGMYDFEDLSSKPFFRSILLSVHRFQIEVPKTLTRVRQRRCKVTNYSIFQETESVNLKKELLDDLRKVNCMKYTEENKKIIADKKEIIQKRRSGRKVKDQCTKMLFRSFIGWFYFPLLASATSKCRRVATPAEVGSVRMVPKLDISQKPGTSEDPKPGSSNDKDYLEQLKKSERQQVDIKDTALKNVV